jgi:hypothetical protein
MAQTSRLTTVSEEFVADRPDVDVPQAGPAPAPRPRRVESAIASMLMMTLRTLPAKTVVALAGIADLAMIASAFVLWLLIIANPTLLQLAGVGGYAIFVLIALVARRRN